MQRKKICSKNGGWDHEAKISKFLFCSVITIKEVIITNEARKQQSK